ncbi:MAG: hypothetical protein BroJett033_8230 [Chloroflexota bacterium]|nr:MAG: hypothetical protein BroJett033_8230 [Chloroflexota bacterium]
MVSDDLLSELQLFTALNPRTQRCVAEQAVLAEYPARTHLYEQGNPPSALYILQAGRVKLYRQSKNKCQILALLAPGDYLGAESLSTNSLSAYTATTLTPVTAITLPPEALAALLNEYPDFQIAFLRLITDRLKQFVTLVHTLAFRDVASRLAMVLITRAETEGQPHDDGVIFDRLLSQQEFAEMVGTAREVVYRTFKRFEQDELVRLTPNSILVRDLETLRAIALQESR